MQSAGLDPKIRAEKISIPEWHSLVNIWGEKNKHKHD
jgi:hypothetical protein